MTAAVVHVERTGDPAVLRWIATPVSPVVVPSVPAPGSVLAHLVGSGAVAGITVRPERGGRVAVEVQFAGPREAAAGAAAVDEAVRRDVGTAHWSVPRPDGPCSEPEQHGGSTASPGRCSLGCLGCHLGRAARR